MPNEQNIQGKLLGALKAYMFCEQTMSGRNPHPEGTNRHRAFELGREAIRAAELEPAIPDSPLSTAPLSESDIARGRELIAQHPEWSDPAWQNRPLRITGVSAGQTREAFFRFDLEDGGRISIPPDQVMRLYNEGEERKILDSPASPTSCEFCNGTGHTEHGFQDCADCGGTGVVTPAEITDSQLLEFAMAHLMIVEDTGPQTRRIYDTREAIDAVMKESQKP